MQSEHTDNETTNKTTIMIKNGSLPDKAMAALNKMFKEAITKQLESKVSTYKQIIADRKEQNHNDQDIKYYRGKSNERLEKLIEKEENHLNNITNYMKDHFNIAITKKGITFSDEISSSLLDHQNKTP